MDTCVRDTMARMIKNTTAFVCPSAYWFLLIAVLYMFRARNSVACTGFPARIRLGAPLVIARFKSNCLNEFTSVRKIHTVKVLAIIGTLIFSRVVI